MIVVFVLGATARRKGLHRDADPGVVLEDDLVDLVEPVGGVAGKQLVPRDETIGCVGFEVAVADAASHRASNRGTRGERNKRKPTNAGSCGAAVTAVAAW